MKTCIGFTTNIRIVDYNKYNVQRYSKKTVFLVIQADYNVILDSMKLSYSKYKNS